MNDSRYNSNNNTNYTRNAQKPDPSSNGPGQGRTVSSGAYVNRTPQNRTVPVKPSVNRPTPNRPIQNRPVQNNSVPKRVLESTRPSSEGSQSSEGSLSPQGMEKTKSSQQIKKAAESVSKKESSANHQSHTVQNNTATLLDFSNMDSEDILKGIVFSEILGKPKALRRGRW